MAFRVELPGLYFDDVVTDATPTRPALVNRDPEPSEVQVPVGTQLAVEIVDVGSDGVDRAATRAYVGGVLAFEGGAVTEFKPGFDGPDSAVTLTSDTLTLAIDPTADFASLQTVNVRVVSATLVSALALDLTYSFQIEDLTAPIVASAQATSAKTVRVSFDEAMRQLGDGDSADALEPANYSFLSLTTPAVSVVPLSVRPASPSAVDVELDIELSQFATYRVIVTNVEDVFGNPIGETGNQADFVGFIPPGRPKQRSFELLRLLPEINRRQDLTGDLKRFMAVLQDVLELLLSEVDRFTDIIDPDRAPEAFLDLMLADLGNPFAFDLSELQKRRLVSVLVQIYKQKGSAAGIRNAIRFFLGVDVTAIDAFHGTTLVLGESELGVDWELGPIDQFALYSFDISVNRTLTDAERLQTRQIVDFMRPAHTHFIDLIEPGAPAFIDHWELGLSELGETSDLH